MYEKLTNWETTKLAAQVRDECGNNLVFNLRKVPRFKANVKAKPQLWTDLRGGTLLTTPIFYDTPDPVRAMFDRLSVTSGFEHEETTYMYQRFMRETKERGLMSKVAFIRSIESFGIQERNLCKMLHKVL